MAWLKKISLVALTAGLTTSCSMYKLEELRHVTPSGTPFQNELSRLYMDFASQEEKEYDWFNSWHFADKGLMLAYGKDVGPEDLNDWNIPADVLPDLQRARESLLAVLTPGVMEASPSKAAEAQFYFDCWVEQQEENWQEDDIATCRDGLTRALGDLHSPDATKMAKGPKHKKAEKKVAKKPVKAEVMPESPVLASESPAEPVEIKKTPARKTVKESPKESKKEALSESPKESPKELKRFVPESTSYAVFFEPGEGKVSEPGMNVITEIVKSLRDATDYAVILHNSKDHPGKAAERIQVIKKLLIAGGVSDSAIHVGSGKDIESDKPVARRVEIFLNE